MLGFFLDFLFPKGCVSCDAFGSYLCFTCQKSIKPVEQAICPMCERQAIDGITHPGCRTRYSLNGLISFYRYDGSVKAAIKRLKYKPYLSELAEILLGVTSNTLISNKLTDDKFNDFLVIPVPLYPQRERERGFNQAAIIGRALAQRLSLPFNDNVLRRTRNTKPQVELKGKERRENLVDAFAITKNYELATMNPILLIDDVWTTGSTMRVCGNILKRAGAIKVWAMTIAR